MRSVVLLALCIIILVSTTLAIQTDHVHITIDPNDKMNIPRNFGVNNDTNYSYSIPPSFIGFSIEISSIMYYCDENQHVPKPWFTRMLFNLKELTGHVPIIRLGGNSGEFSWFNPNGKPMPRFIKYDIKPNWFLTLKGLSEQTGTKFIIGINFLDGYKFSFGLPEVHAIDKLLGWKYIHALQIGNEPDNYEMFAYRPMPYSFEQYNIETTKLRKLILTIAPSVKFQGPDFCCDYGFMQRNYPSDFINLHHSEYDSFGFHLYALSACDGLTPTINQLLEETAVSILWNATIYKNLARKSYELKKPWYLSESNNVVCSGFNGVSDTFAGALWAIDWMFSGASIGASGIHFHATGTNSYTPIIVDPTGKNPYPTAMPIYYAMLLFNTMIGKGSKLLNNKVTSSNQHIKVWSVIDNNDNTVRIVCLNKDLHAKDSAQINIQIVSQEYESYGELIYLEAPTIYSNSSVTLAGQSIDPKTGSLHGERTVTKVSATDGYFQFNLKPASATLFTINKKEM
jgi:hypothetical protein